MTRGSIAYSVMILLAAGFAGPISGEQLPERIWACRQAQSCLERIPSLPLAPEGVAELARLVSRFERAAEIHAGEADREGARTERELSRASAAFLQIAGDCMNLDERTTCRLPRTLVDRLVNGIEFRDGEPRNAFPEPVRETGMKFAWNDENREMARRWMRSTLCRGNLRAGDFEGFEGIVLYSSSCFSNGDIHNWFIRTLNRIGGGAERMPERHCQNIIYSGDRRKVYVTADFVFNARLTWADGVEDVSTRIFEHEMAHHRHFNLPHGQREQKEFLAIRYESMREEFARETKALYSRTDLVTVKGGSVNTERLVREWVAIARRHGVPMRWGEGTGLILRAGLASRGVGSTDMHALDNGNEYFAVAIELYCHERQRAIDTYSRQELEWLAASAGC